MTMSEANRMYGHYNVSVVNMSTEHQFRVETDTGPIMVNQIRMSEYGVGRQRVNVTGRAIKKDGTLAYFNRQGDVLVTSLSNDLRAMLRSALIKVAADAVDAARAIRLDSDVPAYANHPDKTAHEWGPWGPEGRPVD
jgi:hypothetical protein